MKKIVSLLLICVTLLTVLMFTGCGKVYTVEDIKKEGKLVVYTEAGFAPYEFIYDNKLVGVDVDVMTKVAEKLGVELDIHDVNFDTIVGAVQSGKAMVGAAGITITEDRKKSVDFSHPYTKTEQYVIVKADKDIPTVEDLKGKNIGVQQGTTSDILVDNLIKDGTLDGTTLTGYNTPALAAAALDKIDAVVTDKLTAQIIVKGSNDSLKTDKLLKADGNVAAEPEAYGYAVAKGSEELLAVINEVVDEMIASGEISALEEKYNDMAN
ncbi:MAG: ABC transporter substrate-binding protein [Lachnospiraceae bacterium]|nr:ABC transporter substrate-binding protein [Lachnospiraceae bacterium]